MPDSGIRQTHFFLQQERSKILLRQRSITTGDLYSVYNFVNV